MFKQLFFILAIGIGINTSAQQENLDELKKVWQDEAKDDTTRLKAIKELSCYGYLYSQPDSAFYFAQLQYEFAKKKSLKKQMAEALNTQGISFAIRGNYNSAIAYFSKSLKIREEIGDKKALASSLNNLGNIYIDQGDYTKAINHYTRSLKIEEKIDDKKGIATSLNNIGNIYSDQRNYSKSINYYTRSLKINQETNDKPGIAISLNNIGSVYKIEKKYDDAINYYKRSLAIEEEIGDKQGIATSLNNMGDIYSEQGNKNKAIKFYTRSLSLMEDINDQQGIAFCLNNIGAIYFNQKKYPKAINYSSRALKKAQEVGTVVETKDAAYNLYESYKRIGDTKSSLQMYELYITMRDSIENLETQREVISQEFKYNYEKQALADSVEFVKQQELDVLVYQAKQDKERYALLGSFVFLLIVIGVYLRIRFIKRLNEKENLLQQIKLLKAESLVKMELGSSSDSIEHPQLNKENIETTINASLNHSDWCILNALHKTPVITNSQIAKEVSLSIEGVKSSLKKMYRIFNISKSSENKRISLVIEATKLSNNS